MNAPRIVRALLAVTLCLTLTGCSLLDLIAEESGNATEDSTLAGLPSGYDTQALRDRAEALSQQWNTPGSEALIDEEIEGLLEELNDAQAIYARAEMAYYADWHNEELREASERAKKDFYVASEIISWAFANGSRRSDYEEKFAPYVDDSWVDYYISTPLTRIVNAARSSSASEDERLDEYYDAAYAPELSESEANESCAEVYLETLKAQDTSQYLYDRFNRDYTAEQADETYHQIVEKLVPLSKRAKQVFLDDSARSEAALNAPHDDPYEILGEYAPKLSPAIGESAEKLLSEGLYREVSGENCYDGSYTVALPGEQSALMYTYLCSDALDVGSVVHEFGHFHCDWRDTTPVYLQQNCVDIAEAQSQGMEMLFTGFYDEIFGENARDVELLAVINLIDTLLAGFAVGEFEYEVMKNIDTFDKNDVLDAFEAATAPCGIEMQLYQISHLYEEPGYYISYGVSALAAVQIYAVMLEDPDEAVRLYENIASVPSVTGEYAICESLESCGFSDIFDSQTLERMVPVLESRVDFLEG